MGSETVQDAGMKYMFTTEILYIIWRTSKLSLL